MDDASDAKWLTFAELALARGISEPSARKLVRRHKWRRQTGNQGIVRILVPAEALDRPKDDPGTDLPHDPRPDPRPDPSDEPRAIIALEAAIAALREQMEHANSRADRAEHGREGERLRADDLRAQTDALNAEADRALGEARRLRGRADELQAGQELMMDMHARALAALQGDLEMARAQATTAHDALKTLRQAEADRKARGLLARLRAAWWRE
jgi:hypothetical protein